MTTKTKNKYGAEIAVYASDDSFTYWQATVQAYEVEPDPEHGDRWVSHSCNAVDSVEFRIGGSDYCWKWDEQYSLGLHCHGDWRLNTRWIYDFLPVDAVAAGKMAIRLEKRMMAIADEWGNPATPQDVLKRAIQALKPVALRANSDYNGKSGADANRCWYDVRKNLSSMADQLIRQEMRNFGDLLKRKRPGLFERPEAEVSA